MAETVAFDGEELGKKFWRVGACWGSFWRRPRAASPPRPCTGSGEFPGSRLCKKHRENTAGEYGVNGGAVECQREGRERPARRGRGRRVPRVRRCSRHCHGPQRPCGCNSALLAVYESVWGEWEEQGWCVEMARLGWPFMAALGLAMDWAQGGAEGWTGSA